MKRVLPFSGNRFEFEGEHTYFLQPEFFGRLQMESPKPVYLTGPRGTGKTTLLKAFDLNERRTNASLGEQLGKDIFASPAGPFIGVYFRIPDIQLGLIERWTISEPEEETGKLLAFYMDLQWLQEIARAISTLLAEGVLTATLADESQAVTSVIAEYPHTFGYLRKPPQTVAELRTALKRLSSDFDGAARRKTDWRDILPNYDAVQQPGGFGRFVASSLASLCKRGETDEERWHFRICIDEADNLTDLQLRALNSSVRLSKWPVFPIAAFGGVARDYTSTLLPHLSVQDADCNVIDLSTFLTAGRFRELAEGVASARVARVLTKNSLVDLDAMLGTFRVNDLLEHVLTESVSPQAKALLESARHLQREPFFQNSEAEDVDEIDGEDAEPRGHKTLPIYQAYLISRLQLDIPAPADPKWRRRRQESGELRKRMIAAYLSICSDLNTQVRYASARIVLRMSDMCIRDFLKFLNALHLASDLDIDEFITREMHWRDQHEALLAASQEKSRSIRGEDLRAPRETEAVVNGLARLTHLLQTQSENGAHLRTSERGIFTLPVERWRATDDRASQTVRDACNAGFLRFLAEDDAQVCFRVHTSLAPAFQFSYRGAYAPANLMWNDIETLAARRKDDDLAKIAENISRRITKSENLSLF